MGIDELQQHDGACHCGAVRFTVMLPPDPRGARCDCSICAIKGAVTVGAPLDGLEVTEGNDLLTLYQFNTGTAKHFFCATCGIKPFYVPRSHPDGFSVNARCIDSPTVTGMKIRPIDGRNWEQQYPEGRGEFTA